jgi:hypothetical protein
MDSTLAAKRAGHVLVARSTGAALRRRAAVNGLQYKLAMCSAAASIVLPMRFIVYHRARLSPRESQAADCDELTNILLRTAAHPTVAAARRAVERAIDEGELCPFERVARSRPRDLRG